MRNLVIRTFQKMCTWGVYQRSQIGAWLERSIQLVDSRFRIYEKINLSGFDIMRMTGS